MAGGALASAGAEGAGGHGDGLTLTLMGPLVADPGQGVWATPPQLLSTPRTASLMRGSTGTGRSMLSPGRPTWPLI